MKVIYAIAEALRSFWRPTLAFTIVIIIASNYFVLPVIFQRDPIPLPDQFWQLALLYSISYAGFRMAEKITNGIDMKEILKKFFDESREENKEDKNELEL